jgi:Predicted phosphatase homologous to the C-terminal domain of histone macroH2A1
MKNTEVRVVEDDLLGQDVEVIVNAWNRNLFPHWLLWPQGVSGAIRRRAGPAPFREVARHGLMSLGAAVLTSAGRLPFQGIIHVAGIGLLWTASEKSIRLSTRNALALAAGRFQSIALPLIGAGTGGGKEDQVEQLMLEEIEASNFPGQVILVRFKGPGS